MTAPLTLDRLAEVRARADDAQQAFLTGTVGSPPNTEGLSKDDAIDLLGSSATDVPDLLAALDAATERAEKAEAALERVEAALSAHPECDRYAEDDVIICGWKRAVHSVRDAMEGKPSTPENTTVPTEREVLEDAVDHLDYFIVERLGNAASVQSARELRQNLRDALEVRP